MAHKIIREFKLNEISGVDRPAQKGALAVIMKRDTGKVELYIAKGLDALPAAVQEYAKRNFTQAERDSAANTGAALPDGSFPIKSRGDLENAIRLVGHANDPAKAKAHIIARARSLDATSALPSDWNAAKSIGGDLIQEIARVAPRALPELLDSVAKSEAIRDALAKLDDKKIAKASIAEWDVAKNALIASAWSVVDSASLDDAASLLRKTFGEYKDHIDGLLMRSGAHEGDEIMLKAIAKSLGLPETATEAEVLKALADQTANLATVTKVAKRAEAILKMSGKHSAFMNNEKAKMPDGGKEAFADMSADQRDKHMDANPIPTATKAADEEDDSETEKKNCIKVDGRLIRKSVVGDDVFTVMKSQQAAIEKAETTSAISLIEKRVSPFTLIIGKSDAVAGILHRVSKGRSNQADADAIETMLKSGNEILVKSEKITKEFGSSASGVLGTGAQAIQAKAEEILKTITKDAKGKPMSIEKARDMARMQLPEMAKQEEQERRDARKAA